MTNSPYLQVCMLTITLGLNLGCGDAKAMAKRPPRSEPAPIPTKLEATDRYLHGLELGTRNGERMIEQIKRVTIETEGCQGQPSFEKAVIAVTKAIRPPKREAGEDLDLARGYFKGYSSVFRKALHTMRLDCELPVKLRGTLPGTITGDLLCGAGDVDVQLLELVEVEPIFTGWSGGRNESKSECVKVAVKITNDCKIGNEEDREKTERILKDQIEQGCAD